MIEQEEQVEEGKGKMGGGGGGGGSGRGDEGGWRRRKSRTPPPPHSDRVSILRNVHLSLPATKYHFSSLSFLSLSFLLLRPSPPLLFFFFFCTAL